MKRSLIAMLAGWLVGSMATAQTFELRKINDSLYYLNDWRLPYPVYRFQTGDVDGDGREDAMVGVVKPTRYDPVKGRRLFIFKASGKCKARPMWLGTRLGGRLQDFRYRNGRIRSLETTDDGRWVVADYRWAGFGMGFEQFVVKGTDKKTAKEYFSQ
jgi:hypothetical protein